MSWPLCLRKQFDWFASLSCIPRDHDTTDLRSSRRRANISWLNLQSACYHLGCIDTPHVHAASALFCVFALLIENVIWTFSRNSDPITRDPRAPMHPNPDCSSLIISRIYTLCIIVDNRNIYKLGWSNVDDLMWHVAHVGRAKLDEPEVAASGMLCEVPIILDARDLAHACMVSTVDTDLSLKHVWWMAQELDTVMFCVHTASTSTIIKKAETISDTRAESILQELLFCRNGCFSSCCPFWSITSKGSFQSLQRFKL